MGLVSLQGMSETEMEHQKNIRENLRTLSKDVGLKIRMEECRSKCAHNHTHQTRELRSDLR